MISDYDEIMGNIERINTLKCGDVLINQSMFHLMYAMSFLK